MLLGPVKQQQERPWGHDCEQKLQLPAQAMHASVAHMGKTAKPRHLVLHIKQHCLTFTYSSRMLGFNFMSLYTVPTTKTSSFSGRVKMLATAWAQPNFKCFLTTKCCLYTQATLTLTWPSHWTPGHFCLTFANNGGFISISR